MKYGSTGPVSGRNIPLMNFHRGLTYSSRNVSNFALKHQRRLIRGDRVPRLQMLRLKMEENHRCSEKSKFAPQCQTYRLESASSYKIARWKGFCCFLTEDNANGQLDRPTHRSAGSLTRIFSLSHTQHYSYLASMQKGEGTRLGRTILELFENSTDDNNNLIEEQQLWQQVKEAVAKSQAMIREAKEKSDQFGQIDVKTGDRADNHLATIPKESG